LAVRGVCFAKQRPQSGVQPHSDGRNFILTSHLGIQVPTNTTKEEGGQEKEEHCCCCWIQVGQERQTWQRGKLLTIDTSFLHSTGNDSVNEERHVLIIDFWHPELSEAERVALTFLYDLRNKFESGQIPVRPPNRQHRIWQQSQQQQYQKQSGQAEAVSVVSTWWKNLVGGSPDNEE
jgi:Aspartyl/Asparaginyl beta-hydroxylase